MSARQASEAGVFLVSKKTHLLPLLLASYYNYYGPSYYYRLLSQGAPGEGDKETFLQATLAVGAPFYAVSTEVQAMGHLHGERLAGSAMVQVDPRADYVHFSRNKWWAVAKSQLSSPPSIFFIHAHYPKFNPGGNVFGSGSETTPTLKEDGSAGRAWTGPSNVVNSFGYDIERAYWEEIKWVTCHLATAFKSWRYKTGLCQKVESYWHDVFGDSLSFSDKAPEKPYVFYQPSCR